MAGGPACYSAGCVRVAAPIAFALLMVRDARRTALVVDYDAWERAFAMDVLSEEGYSAIGASNGASGLRLTEHFACDVILLDFALPEMSGPEVLRQLKMQESTCEIPVVLLGSTREALDCPVEGRLPRPLKRAEVMDEVQRVLTRDVPIVEPRLPRHHRRAGSIILVASTDAALADRIAEQMRMNGSVACTAHSADGCLRVATAIGPDVVLLDPRLPTRTGLERLLKAHPVSAGADILHLQEAPLLQGSGARDQDPT
jgi:DNA-binding response OmpR family regulator